MNLTTLKNEEGKKVGVVIDELKCRVAKKIFLIMTFSANIVLICV